VCLTVVQGSAWDSKDMADFDFGSDKESSSDEEGDDDSTAMKEESLNENNHENHS
jgi:hypothetical protein